MTVRIGGFMKAPLVAVAALITSSGCCFAGSGAAGPGGTALTSISKGLLISDSASPCRAALSLSPAAASC